MHIVIIMKKQEMPPAKDDEERVCHLGRLERRDCEHPESPGRVGLPLLPENESQGPRKLPSFVILTQKGGG